VAVPTTCARGWNGACIGVNFLWFGVSKKC